MIKMIVRSKAPLRLGLAGGGTDVSPYSDLYGGCVLNTTIDLYAHCTIELIENKIIFYAQDLNEQFESNLVSKLNINNELRLHKCIYNRIVKDFNDGKPLSVKVTTWVDAPAGSGLGSSSTLVVTIIKAYLELLNINLSEYKLANLAYKTEREDAKLAGGKQDQYSAVFGGFNFMEFYKNNKVIINPLKVKRWILNEFDESLLLFFVGQSREGGKIINQQVKNVKSNKVKSIQAMHELKRQSYIMKEAILHGNFKLFETSLNKGWTAKKQIADSITNNQINEIYEFGLKNGAKAAKLSGAGGGGFIMFYCDPLKKNELIKNLSAFNGKVMTAKICEVGVESWKMEV